MPPKKDAGTTSSEKRDGSVNSENPDDGNGLGISEYDLRNLFDLSSEGVAITDENDIFIHVNPAGAEILGIKMNDLEGRSVYEFLPGDSARIMKGQRKRRARNKTDRYTIEINNKQGKTRIIEISASPRTDGRGNYRGSFAIFRDLSEERIKNERMVFEKEKFRNLLNSITVALFQVESVTGRIEDFNPAAEEMTSIPGSELRGKDIRELLVLDGGDCFVEKPPIKPVKVEGSLVNGPGSRVYVLATGVSVNIGDRESIIISVADLSEHKKAEETLHKMNDLLRLINKILRHDMLNNLMIVTMGIEHYFDYGIDSLLQNSMKATNRSLELIRSMKELEFFLTDGGGLREYRIDRIAKGLANNHEIDVKVTGTASVMADEALSSMLDNLIVNSIKHGHATTVEIYIYTDEMVNIDVADNGKGIEDRDKKKVFREGFTTSKNKGTGLGLFIVERTVDRYGGSIEVHDNDPKGVRFRIRLPIPR